MIGGISAAIPLGHLIIEPTVYPVPAMLSQVTDFILSTFLTTMAFVWLKVENDRIERNLRDDQSRLKKLNQELTDAQQVLEKRSEQMIHHSKMTALGEMGSGMAHEINNPLTVAMGNLQLIIAESGKETPSNERVIKYATMALEYNKRIQTIVRALRHYSSDWEDSAFEDADLQEILQETSSLIGTRFRESGTDLLISIGTNPIMINCRSAQISQALMALLFNSYEATKSLPDRWINLMVHESPTEVKISVIDSGSGIPKNVQDKLMQPFFTTKEVGQGKGLGLSTARAIIAQHKGTIHYDPASPNTCFVVTLPKAVSNGFKKAN
jgi:signal transduction histidine kinase